MFRIFLQVARFLREFSDFETPNTPDFRHPPIMGNREVMSIGLIPELIELKMYWGEVVVDLSEDVNGTPRKPFQKKYSKRNIAKTESQISSETT